jgi:hypothetical protein
MKTRLPFGGWGDLRHLELNKRLRMAINRPRRERLLVRAALKRIVGTVYHEIVPFANPYHTGFKETELSGSIQWLDFVVYDRNLGMFVMQFNPQYGQSGLKPHEKRAFLDKEKYITERGFPFLTLSRLHTSQEYEIRIRMFIKKQIRDKEK